MKTLTFNIPTRRFGASLALLVSSTLVLGACGSSTEPSEAALQKITVGTGELSPVNDAIEAVAKENGVEITWQAFSDWTLPNQALVNNETDVNAFQHLAFLSAFNVAQDTEVTPVGSTTISTWGIYSEKFASIDEIPDGATISIPNDPSNGARTLFLLQAAGLIKLADNVGVYPTTDDVIENTKNIVFSPIVAQQLVNVYQDVDAIVVGAATIDKALSIGQEKALRLDDPLAKTSRPYVNVVAVRADDKDNPAYAKLSGFWQDSRVKEALKTENKDNAVVVDVPVAELRKTLAELEELARGLEK